MSYHNTSTSATSTARPTTQPMARLTINALGETAPDGYHYMPDGSLMLNSAHVDYVAAKIIKRFDLDLSPLPASISTRQFSVVGDDGAGFSLEVKNEDNYYYNFFTKAFQINKTGLYDKVVNNGSFTGLIIFPIVTDNDQYDIYLLAQPVTTKHSDYVEVRFGDGSMDINSTTGSNSLLITKVIYQYTDQTLTISPYSSSGLTEVGSVVSSTITLPRNFNEVKQSFKIACSVSTASKSYKIKKPATSSDVLSFIAPVVGDVPITIEGEDIYPAVNNTDIVDGTGFAAGTSTKLVMNTNVADKMAVGDKITIATTDLTDTINGAVSSGVKVVMDSNVATKMAVGDRITAALSGVPHVILRANSSTIVTVAALNPDGDNAKEFSMSQAVSVSDGEVLTFTPKCNRELFTVAALNPDTNNAKEFSYVDAAGGSSSRFGVMDNAVLSFSNQMNYHWPVDDFVHTIEKGMVVVPATNVVANTVISRYRKTITLLPNTPKEEVVLVKSHPVTSTLGKKPVVTRGEIASQAGAITFSNQQALALAGDTLKIGGYGEGEISRVYGYDVIFTDLDIALTQIQTTTTSAVANSTTVPVASVLGILPNVSSASGIGIDPRSANPTVTARSSTTGSGNLTMSVAQTLEDGMPLVFEGAGQTAVITGNIKVLKAGNANQVLRFDVDKLISIT